ncbi:MAG TPA: L-seryl-tRNA(Sec) selenium transferase [Smithellaceae bacterium]|jgi:L-seryl-tRNA(Ser) seleniumtransferase|nr:L-seryl-tRNA(Sec) selenium transferase [Smithellaceae bacterium]HOQ71835.1 L-seryl-tRNA(Sec) selenium transferase [Smithellaceae bacterium]HPL10419.1 L-seryl-tRNA(Sec) selenium transferase [Smithellaceae bacterium]
MDDKRKALLKGLPKIDDVIGLLEKNGIYSKASKDIVREACREIVQRLRDQILSAADKALPSLSFDAASAARAVEERMADLHRFKLRRLVNATGVILHTNLGRAPLCAEAVDRIVEVGRGYSNLEFDLIRGERGLRYDHVTGLICALTGAEDALIVNNNAAAVLLTLNTLAEHKEAIVSRGELIEIGGEFRIPDVMTKSNSILREVGTTNRTRLADYEKAIGPNTGVILKVHTSNYRIVGFTEEAELLPLVALGKHHGIPVFDDLGSGCLVDLAEFRLQHEPTVREVLDSGVDVVTFSGDKLLGGPQAGIIVGKKDIVARIKKNPLNRALRIDKFTLAALEATLMRYLAPGDAPRNLRSLRALTEPLGDVKKRARKLMAKLKRAGLSGLTYELKDSMAAAGGGSLPTEDIPSAVVTVKSAKMSASRMEASLRRAAVPVIVRVDEDEIQIDLRTVAEDEFGFVVDALRGLADSP